MSTPRQAKTLAKILEKHMIFVQNDYTQYRYVCHNGVLQMMQRPITIADLT